MTLSKNNWVAIGIGLTAVLLPVCSKGVSSHANGKADEDRLNQLLKVVGQRAPSIPVPPEVEKSKDTRVREEYFAKRKRQFEEHEVSINAAIDEIAAMGDDVVDWLARTYRSRVGAPRHKIIVVLARIGTPRAREALLDVATAKYDPNRTSYSGWAARNLVRIAPDKEAVLQSLRSNDPEVISTALRHLSGVPVDADLLATLEKLLLAKEWYRRLEAARVIGSDPSEDLACVKVAAIVASCRDVETLPAAKRPFPNPHAYGTIEDHLYFRFIDALANIKGAEQSLRAASDRETGKVRCCLIIARALRGDSSVKQQVYAIIRDEENGLLRSPAVRSFTAIGTEADLPFLRDLAENDPLCIDVHPAPHAALKEEQRTVFYPARFNADFAIRAIEVRAKDRQSNSE